MTRERRLQIITSENPILLLQLLHILSVGSILPLRHGNLRGKNTYIQIQKSQLAVWLTENYLKSLKYGCKVTPPSSITGKQWFLPHCERTNM